MCRMGRRLPYVAALAAVLLVAAPAAGDPGDDKDRVDAELGEARDRLQDAENRDEVLTEELSAISAQARAAAAAAVVEQSRLDVLEVELAGQRARRERIEARLAALVERLTVLRHEERIALERLGQRVREIYMADEPDVVGFVVGATSFTELIDSLELWSRIGRQDERIAERATTAKTRTAAATAQVRDAKEEALAAEHEIAARTAEQRGVRDRLATSRDAVAAAERAKRGALGEIHAAEASLTDEIEALEAESAALAAKIQASTSSGGGSIGPPSAAGLIWPVSGPVTSGFGPRFGRMHEGIDIAVPEGTPVVAAAAGTVIHAGWLGGYGNLVVVDHGNGLATAYAHNSGYAASVGQSVGQGQVVAYSGNTGNSSGPHVHFEVRVNGTAVDPLGYL